MFAFFSHLQNTTVDSMRRVRNGIKICRPKKRNATSKRLLVLKHAPSATTPDHIPCSSFFARAISHSLGAHTAAFDVVLDATDADDDDHQHQQQHQQPTQQDEIQGRQQQRSVTRSLPTPAKCASWLHSARTGVALIPCGRSRLCM